MKILTIAVGRPKSNGLAGAIRDYESRIKRYFTFEAIEVRAERISPDGDSRNIPETESRALLAKVPPGLDVIALDRRGVRWTSEELAAYFEELAVMGKPGVAFLVGGALGLSADAMKRADKVLSISSLTLPHELARLVLAEQIYRSGTISRGEPYHKGG